MATIDEMWGRREKSDLYLSCTNIFTPPMTVSGCHISATKITWIDASRPGDNTRWFFCGVSWKLSDSLREVRPGLDSVYNRRLFSSRVTLRMVIFLHPPVCKMSGKKRCRGHNIYTHIIHAFFPYSTHVWQYCSFSKVSVIFQFRLSCIFDSYN